MIFGSRLSLGGLVHSIIYSVLMINEAFRLELRTFGFCGSVSIPCLLLSLKSLKVDLLDVEKSLTHLRLMFVDNLCRSSGMEFYIICLFRLIFFKEKSTKLKATGKSPSAPQPQKGLIGYD